MPYCRETLPRFGYRPTSRLEAYAAISAPFAELVQSHPIAFFALATGYGPLQRRSAAVRALHNGCRLPVVCRELGIPYCLRRLPPEACLSPLPYFDWRSVDSGSLADIVPHERPHIGRWLTCLFFSAAACTPAFALWVSRHHELYDGGRVECRHLLPLALYVWHASRPQAPLHRFVPAPWTTALGLRRALVDAREWLNCVMASALLTREAQIDPWVDGGRFAGCEFVPLLGIDDLLDESRAMNNCVDRYVGRIHHGRCRLFSVRRAGRRVATLEMLRNQSGGVALGQLKAYGNADVSTPLRKLAERWIAAQAQIPSPRERSTLDANSALTKLLLPYREDTATPRPWLEAITLNDIDANFNELARRAGIPNWPPRLRWLS